MTMTLELPEGPLELVFTPSQAAAFRDTLDGFIKAAEAQGFPVPIRE